MSNYPFPGMNPYFEHSSLWPNIHLGLINAIQVDLTPKVVPTYYVTAEERTYIAAIDPDTLTGRVDVAVLKPQRATGSSGVSLAEPVAASSGAFEQLLTYPVIVETPMTEEIREYYLEIRQTSTDEVVTVIEVLSPANKRTGIGRSQYKKKREQVLSSLTNLIEIDLLRSGKPFDVSPQYEAYQYRILVSRGWQRPRGELYPFNVTHPIPEFPVPLQRGEAEPILNLGHLLESIYTQSRYDLRINYAENPVPEFDQKDQQWLDATLRETGHRQ